MNSKTDFQEYHIQLVLAELQTRFGFPAKDWKRRFASYTVRVQTDTVGKFMYFGNDIINPVLNEILCRRDGFPTFNKLCEYVVKKK